MSEIALPKVHEFPKFLPDSNGGPLRQVLDAGSNFLRAILPRTTPAGVDPAYQSIMDKQMELQRQMLLVSMHTNLEKTKHDIQMAPVRNIRVN
mgnify:CR=1 FL=1